LTFFSDTPHYLPETLEFFSHHYGHDVSFRQIQHGVHGS